MLRVQVNKVIVVGAGMAGSEAAWQVAQRGIPVELYEMRPVKSTPAHKTDLFAELVCSNSLRGAGLENAVGVLKEEMRRLGSIIMEAADATKVPAGGALAVDRLGFSRYITDRVKNHPLIKVIHEEVEKVPREPDAVTIVASGPLTGGKLAEDIGELMGQQYLYFYDAAAPIVTLESVDMAKAWKASRYNKGEAAYINCPMDREQYRHFWQELVNAEKAETHSFEKEWKSEAYCWRAWNLFQMSQLWGDSPLVNSIPPAITAENIEEVYHEYYPARTARKEVYEKMIEELTFAAENGPAVNSTNKNIFTRAFAHGMLARSIY